MLVSVLLPTRGRLAWLQESLDSLFECAAHPEDIEVLLGMDDDDTVTQKDIQPYLAKYPTVKSIEFPRHGYAGLHHYVNGLAQQGVGRYFLLWNDDARMKTKRWDDVLRNTLEKDKGQLRVYQVQNNSGVDVFGLVPREWIETLGHLSLAAPYDSWVNDIADTLGINTPISIYAHHIIGEERENSSCVAPIPSEAYRIGQQQLYSQEGIAQRRRDAAKLHCIVYPDLEEC